MIEDMIKEFIPKEGDIVKIVTPYSEFERNYMLVIWPNENKIIFGSEGYASVTGVDFLVDLNGEYHDYYKSFGFNTQEDTLMKPNMHDIFEVSRILLNNKLRYNRKKKQIIKVENYESNR
jgi:hypothetical protein